ncbi:hypothetical protein FOA52_013908 [Chlamydomonas sp. UWO 241]|nr:hypothetical protein FOA52_013908 [Chlamydomonas sp. UWO 241]
MVLLEAVALTTSGRPVLEAREVELFTLDKVDVEFEGRGGVAGHQAEAYKGGYVVLTSQRLIWLSRGKEPGSVGLPCWLPLHSVNDAVRRNKLAFGGTKVRVHVQVAASFEGKPTSVDGQFHKTIEVRLRCRGDAPDSLVAKMQEARCAAAAKPAVTGTGTGTAAATAGAKEGSAPQGGAPAGGGRGGGAGDGLDQALARAQQQQQQQAQQGGQQAQQQAQQARQAAVVVDDALLRMLVDMGFARNRSARSLLAVSNAGCQQAIDYMLAFGKQPGMDDALPASAWGGQRAGQQMQQQQQAQAYQQQQQQQQGYQQQQQQGYGAGAAYGGAPQQYGAPQYGGAPQYDGAPQQYGAPQYGGAPRYGAPQPYGAHAAPAATATTATAVAAMGVGVAGIMRREERKAEESERAVSAATQDLTALMAMAGDMVKLAERFRGVMAAKGQGDEDELMDADTQLELIAMGIASPVTKESAGSRYATELARQLADFLEKPLAAQGGIMTLPDVYCLYNRARGSELVSPDDLLASLRLFDKLGLPLKMRTLSSGMLVLQAASHSEAAVCARIAALVSAPAADGPDAPAESATGASATSRHRAPAGCHLGPPIAATDVARALSVSMPIAREHLLTAELRGVLCRDDGPDGLRFYHNFFRATAAPAQAR